ncbi:helix-turn-helix domain-containing protein [Clostridium folliculivorans]|uniref:2-hydroxyacid dehydrogenase n=1 Tax=Clostridium folliculivorans TaxID=2886038 RepID=A0A9W5Y4I1_9CLOT|nr:helix-turn-helix domain-containing protein [Clostridium folliculivorans]GKU26363.1 2-hydroxyacid dehydrogenase [Clostridium folliculivorans]GKU32082.1 2-hydroxyacid dehydrogenase [Clostridium folliculivorans]
MEEKLYTIDQVAEILGMHHKTIRKFITEGKLRAAKVGKQWRISGHDLSLFMENSDIQIDRTKEEENLIEFSTSKSTSSNSQNKINVSSVVDINELNIDEYNRISNSLLALMNSKDPNLGLSTIKMQYSEKENRLRVLLWGDIKFTEEVLSFIKLLTEK